MKPLLVSITTILTLTLTGHAAVLVDDTWADGSRSNGPMSATNSIWYASTSAAGGTNLTAVPNTMTFWTAASARMILTYFTPTNTTQTLAVGDTLKVTLQFTPSNVATQNNSGGLRIALVNYGGSNRVNADGYSASGANGAGVTGYMNNVNFGQTFGLTRPIDTRQRTNITSSDLLGTLNVYERLTNGPSVTTGTPGFSNAVSYTFQFIISRTDLSTVTLTSYFFGPGLAITNTAVDAADPTVSFDAVAFRAGDDITTASSFDFSEYKVELIPGAPLPAITAITRTGADVALSFTGAAGQNYRLWSSTDLSLTPVTNTWSLLTGGSFSGSADSFTHTNGATDSQRFYVISSP